MDDQQIVKLYWQRCDSAIRETSAKYGHYLMSIAFHILYDHEDAQECVNDTYYDAWNSMPPHRPEILATFLGKITRRISIDRWRYRNSQKHGGGELPLALEELQECITQESGPEEQLIHKELIAAINRFLGTLPKTQRQIFLCRYWYLDTIREIAGRFHYSESKVLSILFRTRNKLRMFLEKEGY